MVGGDRPGSGQPDLSQRVEQFVDRLADHVGLDQVADRVPGRPGHHRHVGHARIAEQQFHHRLGQLRRHHQPQV